MARDIFFDDFTVHMRLEQALVRSKLAKKVPGVSFRYTSRGVPPHLKEHVVGTTSVEDDEALARFNKELQKIISIIPLDRKLSRNSS